MTYRRRIALFLLELVVPISILAVWWVVSSGSKHVFWPPLSEIVQRFQRDWFFDAVPKYLLPTLRRLAVGFAIAIAIGISVGVLLGAVRSLRDAFTPALDYLRSIPGAAMLVPAILLLGAGDTSKVALVVFVCVWPILLNTIDGVRGIDPSLHDLANVYQLGVRRRLFSMIMPAASPQIFAGLRVALARALLSLLVFEMFLSVDGLGQFIQLAQMQLDMRNMWTGVFVLMIVSYLVNLIFVTVEGRVLNWHRGSKAAAFGGSTQ
jgi:ABC-type nitrate/sulfonate/bicarbonate transport system permease component